MRRDRIEAAQNPVQLSAAIEGHGIIQRNAAGGVHWMVGGQVLFSGRFGDVKAHVLRMADDWDAERD